MKLFFREYGQGRPMIILHGLFGMSDNWVTLAKVFADRLKMRIIIPDLRNHGHSGHSSAFSYFSLVEDLVELYDDLDISSAVLLGHSMGGKVAMHFALDFPSNVEKLIVADISPVKYNTYRHAFLLEVMSEISFSEYKTKREVETVLFSRVNDKRLVNFMLKNIRNISRDKLGWRMNIDILKLNLEEVFKFEPTGNRFDRPVLWLKGEHSDYILPEHRILMYAYFSETTLKIIPEASHWLHADNPEAFANEILLWMKL